MSDRNPRTAGPLRFGRGMRRHERPANGSVADSSHIPKPSAPTTHGIPPPPPPPAESRGIVRGRMHAKVRGERTAVHAMGNCPHAWHATVICIAVARLLYVIASVEFAISSDGYLEGKTKAAGIWGIGMSHFEQTLEIFNACSKEFIIIVIERATIVFKNML
ncbi:unnamed protein product, partial [Iphiclides podalirius]